MSSLIGSVQVQNGPYVTHTEVRRKDDQNQLVGIAWQAAGTALCTTALYATAKCAGMLVESGLMGLGVTDGGHFIEDSYGFYGTGLLLGAAVLGDIALVKGVAECFTNAIYHLGSEVEITCDAPSLNNRQFAHVI